MKKVFSTILIGLILWQSVFGIYAASPPNTERIAPTSRENEVNTKEYAVSNTNSSSSVAEDSSAKTEDAPIDNGVGEKMPTEISKALLQEILIDIKTRMVINDENAKLTYSLASDSGQAYYELSWEGQDYTQSVRYGEDKNIYNYSYYEHDRFIGDRSIKKLPKYSQEESRAIAKDFIGKAFPEEYKNFRNEQEPRLSGEIYIFPFDYYKDDILVSDITASVTVNYITGKVTDFTTDYFPNIEFENQSGILNKEQAEKAYQNEIGLQKVYTYQFNEDKMKIFNVRMAYVPAYDSSYSINAKTGKREHTDGYDPQVYSTVEEKSNDAGSNDITPLEQAEIEKKSELRSLSEAKKEAVSLNLFDAAGFEMSYANLYERNYSVSNYVWALNFEKENENYSIGLDAKTLDLVDFFDYNHFGNYQEIREQDVEAAKKSATEFLQKYASAYLDKVSLNEVELEELIGTQNDVIRMKFERYEGGAYLSDDALYIHYMPSENKITYCSIYWSDLRLPKPTKFADPDIVLRKIFEENGLQLAYKLKWDEQALKYTAKLYYYIKPDSELPLKFSITTGDRILQTTSDKKIEQYEDVESSKYPEEVRILHQIGIGFSGGMLKPNIPITQKELLDLIHSSFEFPYYRGESGSSDSAKSSSERYKAWIRMGLLLEGEEVSDIPATREEVAKYLVRAMGYEKIAAKSEIFKSDLYDFEEVTSGYEGYVSISEALRFLDVQSGGEFRPKDHATRDDAVKMLYNFLAFR